LGIKNSIGLYDFMVDKTDEELAGVFESEASKIMVLRHLLDVGKLRYVSPVFATVLVRSGYDSIEKIAEADPKVLHEAIMATNRDQDLYKGNVGDSDARFLVDDAKVYLSHS
jgi:hypothetical protein